MNVKTLPRGAVKSSWIRRAVTEDVAPAGAYVEFGLYKGETFRKVEPTFRARGERSVGFDSFNGLLGRTAKDGRDSRARPYRFTAPAGTYEALVAEFPAADIVKGDVRDTAMGYMRDTDLKFAVVLLDMDLYLPTLIALKALLKHDRLAPGALIIADEFFLGHYPGERRACYEMLGKGWERIYAGAAVKVWEG